MPKSRSALKGFMAGAVGGALGTLVLNVFQRASLEGTRVAEKELAGNTKYTEQQEQLLQTFEKAHNETAEGAARAVGVGFSAKQHPGTAITTEFAFGILCAGIYGALAEFVPSVTAGFGTVYGSVLFAERAKLCFLLLALCRRPRHAHRSSTWAGGPATSCMARAPKLYAACCVAPCFPNG